MATRSAIAVMHGDRVKAVYCHWDGYVEHNGFILQTYYNDTVSANKLISMGDISSLGSEVGEKHEFGIKYEPTYVDNQWGVSVSKECTFYNRDRGEDTSWKSFDSLTEFVEYYFDGPFCEYAYVLMDGYWQFCTRNNRCFRPVDETLKEVFEKEPV